MLLYVYMFIGYNSVIIFRIYLIFLLYIDEDGRQLEIVNILSKH